MIGIIAKYRTGIDFNSTNVLGSISTTPYINDLYEIIRDENGINRLHKKSWTSGGTNPRVKINNVFEIGKKYKITFRLKKNTGGGYIRMRMSIYNGGNSGWLTYNSSGTYTRTVTPSVNYIEITQSTLAVDWELYDLIIEEISYTELDTDVNEMILLSKSLKDVKSPDKISGEYSKTFILPSTPVNDKFFKNVKTLDHTTSFNAKKKIKASIEEDGMSITHGDIQLVNIINENGKINYEVLFKGPETTFFSDLKNKKLNQIESNDIPSHIYDIEGDPETQSIPGRGGVLESWAYADGVAAKAANWPYVYSLIDIGQNFNADYFSNAKNLDGGNISINNSDGLNIYDYTLHFWAWYIWDKLHTEAGYTYEGDIFSNPDFLNLAIPIGKMVRNINSNTDYIKFIGHIPKTYTINAPTKNSGPIPCYQYPVTFEHLIVNDSNGNIISNNGYHTPNIYGERIGSINKYKWLIPDNTIHTKLKIKVSYKIHYTNEESSVTMQTFIQQSKYNTTSGDYKYSSEYLYLGPPEQSIFWWRSKVNENYVHVNNDSTPDDYEFYEFEVDKILLRGWEHYNENKGSQFYGLDGAKKIGPVFKMQILNNGTGKVIIDDVKIEVIGEIDDIEKNVTIGDIITNPTQYLDEKTTCLDFFKDIINIFNLYVEIDEENKHITYNSFNGYYGDGKEKDFTTKLALDEVIEKDFLSNLNNGRYVYEHKIGNDIQSKDYFERNNEVAGTIKINTGNEFNDNELKITTKYISSTSKTIDFLGGNYFTNIIDAQTKNGIINRDIGYRLVYPRRITNTNINTKPNKFTNLFLVNFTDSRLYISNTHQNQNIPSNSIFFNDLKDVYTYKGNTNNNNLLENYWGDYLDITLNKDNYILTAKFKLNAVDYANLSLKDIIIIDNQKYYINKIKDFNPDKLTELELLRFNKS